jgi:hypothetical protein
MGIYFKPIFKIHRATLLNKSDPANASNLNGRLTNLLRQYYHFFCRRKVSCLQSVVQDP